VVTGLVLAAGESKRMRKPKMLLPFRGRTIIETVLGEALKSGLDETWVVLGGDREAVEEKIIHLPVKICVNRNFKKGMLSSIHRGLQSISPNTEAVCLILGDQPEIHADTINHLIRAFRKSEQGMVIPVYKGRRGHPVIIDAGYRKEIFVLNPDIGLKELMQRHPGDIHEVEMDEEAVLKDIDTPEDYQKLSRS